jgi:hypothetical protein
MTGYVRTIARAATKTALRISAGATFESERPSLYSSA